MTAPPVWLHSEKDSPSCGIKRVKIWDAKMPSRDGVGSYVARLMEKLPFLAVEEEGRLGDPILRENFIKRVFALCRWYHLIDCGLKLAGRTGFHARHKPIIMSHDQLYY